LSNVSRLSIDLQRPNRIENRHDRRHTLRKSRENAVNEQIDEIVREYSASKLNRRELFSKLIAITGTYAAAQLFLEQSGVAQTVVSRVESARANVDSATVEYMNGGTKLTGYLSKPRAKGRYPAIIVIHENRGLNDHTRHVARRFASEGYVALAADALSRSGGTASMPTPEKVREAFAAISSADVLSDLNAGLAFLNKHENVKKGKLASIGFCWGGARSFLLAAEPNDLKAAVVFYGTAPDEAVLAKVHAPVLGIYGETDTRITSVVPNVADTMKKLRKKYEYKIYPGAAHAFFNDTGQRYNAEAAKDAWATSLDFLKRNI
jgi:carboxymethylenebutenolidase